MGSGLLNRSAVGEAGEGVMTTFLVTGGAGFIGSHLTEYLLAQGHRVLAIDNLSTGDLANVRHLFGNPAYHFVRASITDKIVMDRLASQSEVVVHLAAAVGVRLIVEHPVHTIETNVMGTEAVLQSALRYGCLVLIASTSEVYGKGSRVPFVEGDDVLLGPTTRSRWAYAASKMVDEFLALAYHREHGLPVVCFRLFNTVGARQTGRYGMVIPRFVQQALGGQAWTVYGDGRQSRCFCDVRDVVQAIAAMADCPEAIGGVYNIGSTDEITIEDLARRVVALVQEVKPECDCSQIAFVPYEEAYETGFEDMARRVPDIDKVRQAIGWQPQISLDETLRHVITYYREGTRDLVAGPCVATAIGPAARSFSSWQEFHDIPASPAEARAGY
jgi:UDP-glucose 4-epimerase